MELEACTQEMVISLADFVAAIQQRLPATATFNGDVQLMLSRAEASSSVLISGRPDRPIVVAERSGPADTAIRANLDDLWAVLHGQNNLRRLFADGRIQVDGDVNLAVAFVDSLRLDAPPSTGAEAEAAPQARFAASEHLAASQPPVLDIARVADLEPRELQDHARLGRPVILTRAVEHWPLRKATWQEIREAFSEMRGTAFGDRLPSGGLDREVHQVQIGSFIQQILDDAPSLHTPGGLVRYLASNTIPEGAMHLLEHPRYFPREAYCVGSPRVWIGPRDTVTPMHRDTLDNLFVQVLGRKSFVLGAPDQSDKLYPWALASGGEFVQVDPDAPDLARFPRFAEARLLRFVLEPGEMLFLPRGWFHHVRALESQISVNFWLREDHAL